MVKYMMILSKISTVSLLAKIQVFLLTGLVVVLFGAAASPSLVENVLSQHIGVIADTSEATIGRLRAFTKLYGYVRYFHPSDAASTIDWERFAVYGVRQINKAESQEELKETLEALFHPIAPTIQVYEDSERPPAPIALLTPGDTTSMELVFWQHRGIGLENRGPYRSIRLNRTMDEPTEPTSGWIGQRINAVPYRGREIRMQAAVKTEVSGSGNQAQLMLYVELQGRRQGFIDGIEDLTAPDWETYEITGAVAEDAEYIGFGGVLVGSGIARFDGFQLHVYEEVNDQWLPISIKNGGFEDDSPGAAPSDWDMRAPGYQLSINNEDTYEGLHSLTIESEAEGTIRLAWPLFEERPEAGEVVERPLGQGLNAQIPLSLYSMDGQTLRPEDAPSLNKLEAALQEIDLDNLTTEDAALRCADVIIAWNVFQHFYPYFDVIDTDWDAVLTTSLGKALVDETAGDFHKTLRRMLAQLHDGHGGAYSPEMRLEAIPPFMVDWIEDQVVIVASGDSARFKIGDVVLSVDGTSAKDLVMEEETFISGSPQWKRYRALQRFGVGLRDSEMRMDILRGEQQIEVLTTRSFSGQLSEKRPANIEEIEEGVYYVNLDLIEAAVFEEHVQELATARGVIFDLRGYPNGNHGALSYLTDKPLRSARWQVPQIIYPDREDIVGYDTTGRWFMHPTEPRFKGKIVFITDGRAISYAESVMGIVEHYELAEIVGHPTAGTNGNINPFTLPGDYRIIWTGMRVLKHDGSQHHLVGIQPTVQADRTIEGVRAGRDEYLERALALIMN